MSRKSLIFALVIDKRVSMKRKNILIMALAAAMMLSAATPVLAAPTEVEPLSTMAPEGQEISVSVSGNTIRVAGAAKQTLVVYYVTGAKAASFAVETEDQTISTNLAKGVYLLKVGKLVRKVSIS